MNPKSFVLVMYRAKVVTKEQAAAMIKWIAYEQSAEDRDHRLLLGDLE